jgi:Stage II sporulation protein E (SpoIIE)
MLQAGFRWSRQGGVRFLAPPFSLLLWTLLLVCSAASGAGQSVQAALAHKSTAAPAAAGAFNAAGMGTGSRTIDGRWQFHLGDDPRWAQPAFDDSKWEQLPADQPWGDAGHLGYTGFAWYRRQIALDPADKNPLGLLLPPLDSVAEVYWNGVKVGGIGTPPPHAFWYYVPQPAAVPLPAAPGASSGTLAIRLWLHTLDSNDAPDAGGFLAAPRLGYAPLIRQMRESWVEHYLRVHALRFAAYVIFLCAGLTALVLWLRSPSQWILLCVGAYFVSYVIGVFCAQSLSLSFRAASSISGPCIWIDVTAFLFLILLLAGLPNRPGVRGFRFWKRVCLAASALGLLSAVLAVWEILLITQPRSALFHFLDTSSELLNDSDVLFAPLVLIACLVLSKSRLPRLLFMAAAGVDTFLQALTGALSQYFTRLDSLLQLLHKPLFDIYGSTMSVFVAAKLLLLAAIVYAVWDQLSRQLAEQRRVNTELKAAQEVQTVLVAAAERGAPGYAVASVYRPASEVGGDFFQVIPLQDDGTLIVAGDVSGKGLGAGMTVSLLVGAMRTLAEQDSSPAAVLAGLNRRLIGRTQGGFATCCAVRIDPTGHATGNSLRW